MMKEHGHIEFDGYVKCSAKSGAGVKNVFETACKAMLGVKEKRVSKTKTMDVVHTGMVAGVVSVAVLLGIVSHFASNPGGTWLFRNLRGAIDNYFSRIFGRPFLLREVGVR